MSHSLDVGRMDEVLASLADNTERLTVWERQFVESVSDQWTLKGHLSDKQLEIIERIYLKV